MATQRVARRRGPPRNRVTRPRSTPTSRSFRTGRIRTSSCGEGLDALSHVVAHARGLLEYLIDVELDDRSALPTFSNEWRVSARHDVARRQDDPVVRGMLKAYADTPRAGSISFARRPMLSAPWSAKFVSAAKGARVNYGPRPFEARVARQRSPGQEERKAIVGALLDFPLLLDDSEVARRALDCSKASRHGLWRRSRGNASQRARRKRSRQRRIPCANAGVDPSLRHSAPCRPCARHDRRRAEDRHGYGKELRGTNVAREAQ